MPEEDFEDLEPADLEEEPVVDLPVDFPDVALEDFEVGDDDEEEPDFALLPEAEVRLLLVEPVFELVFEPDEAVLPDSLRPCISPDDMEEAELPIPDWLEPDIDFESEPEPDIEDCPEFF